MPFNIVEAIGAQITPQAINRVALSSGETPSRTRSAMSSGVLAVATGIVHRGSTTPGAAALLSTLQSPGARGGDLTSSLLGDGAEPAADAITRSSGVTRSTAYGVLSVITPVAAGVLGREVGARRLDASGLADMLQQQKHHLTAPADIRDEIDRDDIRRDDIRRDDIRRDDIRRDAQPTQPVPHATAHQRNWLPLLGALLLGALLLGLLVFFRGHRPAAHEQVSTPPQQTAEAPVVVRPPAGAPAKREQVGQATLTGGEIARPSVDELSGHLTGTGKLPDRFALPGTTFEYGTATLTGGEPGIDRLAALMREHPSARIRLEGHTDSVGTAEANAALSHQRAAAVKKMLEDRGVAGQRIETLGRRDLDPINKDLRKAGRAENRRVDVVVLER